MNTRSTNDRPEIRRAQQSPRKQGRKAVTIQAGPKAHEQERIETRMTD